MAIGALVTEGLKDDPKYRDASPYLVWEWLVVQAIVREMSDGQDIGGAPGRHMARREIDQHGYRWRSPTSSVMNWISRAARYGQRP
jgi:hypothetical protein